MDKKRTLIFNFIYTYVCIKVLVEKQPHPQKGAGTGRRGNEKVTPHQILPFPLKKQCFPEIKFFLFAFIVSLLLTFIANKN